MPRNVRNFWIRASIDGREELLESGPRAQGGGFDMNILMRERGGIIEAVEIIGRAGVNGLTLRIRVPGHEDIIVHTDR